MYNVIRNEDDEEITCDYPRCIYRYYDSKERKMIVIIISSSYKIYLLTK